MYEKSSLDTNPFLAVSVPQALPHFPCLIVCPLYILLESSCEEPCVTQVPALVCTPVWTCTNVVNRVLYQQRLNRRLFDKVYNLSISSSYK